MTNAIQIGRMLRSGTMGFIVGCRVDQLDVPRFGELVRAPIPGDSQVYGLIHDIRIDDDGLVRQLATADTVNLNTIADNRVHRNMPVEISVLSVGYRQNEEIKHLLPPRPPLSLDAIHKCSFEELRAFTAAGRFGYFRHILQQADFSPAELLAAHIEQAHEAHSRSDNSSWATDAVKEIITLLRDDYATLMAVMGTLRDALGDDWE